MMLDARDILGTYDIPDYAEASLMEVMSSGVKEIQQYARSHHRFQRRTGALIDAISSESFGLSGRVYIDDIIAYYGVYVHEGQRSWAPDQFVYKAVSALLPDLKSDLHQALVVAEKDYAGPERAPEIPIGRAFKPVDFTPRYAVRDTVVPLTKGAAERISAKVGAIKAAKKPVIKSNPPPLPPAPVNKITIANLFKLGIKSKKGTVRGLIGELLGRMIREEELSSAKLVAELKARLKAMYKK